MCEIFRWSWKIRIVDGCTFCQVKVLQKVTLPGMKVKSKMKQGQEIFLIWAKMENELSAAWGDQEMKVLQIWKSFKYWDKAETDLLHFWLLASVDLVLNLDIVLPATDRELVHRVTEVHLSYYNSIDWRRNFLNYSNYSRKLFENINIARIANAVPVTLYLRVTM